MILNRHQWSIPSSTPVYDANGNLTADGFHTYAWDAERRTVTIDSGTFTYDALDRRLDFGASGSYQQYFYPPFDLNYNFGQAAGTAGQLGLRIPAPGGGQVNMTPTGVSGYRHPNWQGSQVVNSTTTRTVAGDNAFTPFGERYAINSYSGYFAGMLMQYPYMTDGYQADERLYHDGQGRWMSPDPAGLGAVDLTNPQSLNRYVYVMNDPLNNVDPSGLMQSCPSGDGYQLSPNQFWVFTTCEQASLAYPGQITCGTYTGGNQFGGSSWAQSGRRGGGGGSSANPTDLTGPFSRLDCAGYKAARNVRAQTTAQGVEFGGFIYQSAKANSYYFSTPFGGTPGALPSFDVHRAQGTPGGFTLVGWYHSHPQAPGYPHPEMFSGADLGATRRVDGPGYLLTPSGRAMKLLPYPLGLQFRPPW